MTGYIPVPVVPESCEECPYKKHYICHAYGEYNTKYTAWKYIRPDWCPIREEKQTK